MPVISLKEIESVRGIISIYNEIYIQNTSNTDYFITVSTIVAKYFNKNVLHNKVYKREHIAY